MNTLISRRKFIQKAGFGLANATVLSLIGCRTAEYDVPQVIYTPPYTEDFQTEYTKKLPPSKPKIEKNSRWLPFHHLEDKSRWKAILVHHTATYAGSASIIDRIHRNRGFDGLGYDFIINSGNGNPDGLVEVGYRWKRQITGAHCRSRTRNDNYWNEHAIGIVLVGNFEEMYPTDRQYESLAKLIAFLKNRYYISGSNILGHKQVSGCITKCPGRNFSWYRINKRLHSIS